MGPINAVVTVGYGVTIYSGMKKANLKTGSKVGIIGLGNLGLMAVKVLDSLGMETTVFSHSPDKKDLALKCGAREFILTSRENGLGSLKSKYGLIVDCSSADLELSDYLDMLKPDGKFCYLGLPFNTQKFTSLQLADYGSKAIYGSYIGSVGEIRELLKIVSNKEIRFDVVTFSISEHVKAVDHIKKDVSPKRVVLYW